MFNLGSSFNTTISHGLQLRLSRVMFFCACFLLPTSGCTFQDSSNSQSPNYSSQKSAPISEPSPLPNSSIPSKSEVEQQKADLNQLLKESERLEKEANDLIRDKVPSGERAYQDLSKGRCDWLKQRAAFYEKFADSLNQQANQMVPASSPQTATLQQEKVARQRATSFQNELSKRCTGK